MERELEGAKFRLYLPREKLMIWRCQSCSVLEWVESEDSQVVQTAWAVMGLMYAKYPHPEPIERAVKLVMSRQLPVRTLCAFTLGFTFMFRSCCRTVRGHKKRQRG